MSLKKFLTTHNLKLKSAKTTAKITILLLLSFYLPVVVFFKFSDPDNNNNVLTIFLFLTVFTFSPIYLYFHEYYKLATYLKKLSQNKMVALPKIRGSSPFHDLSDSLNKLQKTWETTNHELSHRIAETKLLFNTIPDPIMVFNPDQVVLEANRAAKKIFKRDLIGYKANQILDDSRFNAALIMVLHDLSSKQIEVKFTLEGQENIFHVKFDCLHYGKPQKVFVIAVLQDITEIRRTDDMFGDFVTNASHEIRTPLASILGITETILSNYKTDPDVIPTFLPMIMSQAERMKNLISDLLNLANVQNQENTPVLEFVDLVGIIKQVKEDIDWKSSQNNNTVVLKLIKSMPKIKADASQMHQVFFNLLNNAVNYGRPGSPIIITSAIVDEAPDGATTEERAAQYLKVSVIDQGEGIEPAHLARLTERFYRVDKSRSRKVGGTGLGLSIVKQILKRHSGLLEIKSKVNVGSEFSIYLPINDAAK